MAERFNKMNLDKRYKYLMGMLLRYKAVLADVLNDDKKNDFLKSLFALHIAEGAAECFENLQYVLFLLNLRYSKTIKIFFF